MRFYFKWITPYGPIGNDRTFVPNSDWEDQVDNYRGLASYMSMYGLPYSIEGEWKQHSNHTILQSTVYQHEPEVEYCPKKIVLRSGEIVNDPLVYELSPYFLKYWGFSDSPNLQELAPVPEYVLEEIRAGRMFFFLNMITEAIGGDHYFGRFHRLCHLLNIPPDRFVYGAMSPNMQAVYSKWADDNNVTERIRILEFPCMTLTLLPFIVGEDKIPLEHVTIEKKFLILTRRILAGARSAFQVSVFNEGLDAVAWMSHPTVNDTYLGLNQIEKHFSKQELKDLITVFWREYGWTEQEIASLAPALDRWSNALPMLLDWKNEIPSDLGIKRPVNLVKDYCHTSLFHMVLEMHSNTITENIKFIKASEKSYKGFDSYQIPIWFSTPGVVEEIRKQGFDVFDDIIDHSYDTISDMKPRMEAVIREMKRLDQKYSIDDCNMLRNELMPRLQANLDLRYNWTRVEHNRLTVEQSIYEAFKN